MEAITGKAGGRWRGSLSLSESSSSYRRTTDSNRCSSGMGPGATPKAKGDKSGHTGKQLKTRSTKLHLPQNGAGFSPFLSLRLLHL